MTNGRRYLVTGGAGFIGSNFIRHLMASEPEAEITNLDLLTYAGLEANLADLDGDRRHTFVHGDIRDADQVGRLVPGHDVIVHFAAESHVDNSIADPTVFTSTNVLGTATLLEAARDADTSLFLHVSTDEVYGSIASGEAGEGSALNPSSPYSASKAASDLLVGSYVTTFGLPAIVTRSTNNYGPFQYPEKVIPLFATNAIEDIPMPLYGDGKNRRDWVHVTDHCRALSTVIDRGTPGETYNIGSGARTSNIDLAEAIAAILGKDESIIERVADRPGHDRRYAVDITKIRSLGWAPGPPLEERLAETVEWYRANTDWWKPLKGAP